MDAGAAVMTDHELRRRFRCPECGQDEVMDVVGAAWITVTGDGTERTGEPDGDVEWDSDAIARCPKCGHQGKWSEFRCEEDTP